MNHGEWLTPQYFLDMLALISLFSLCFSEVNTVDELVHKAKHVQIYRSYAYQYCEKKEKAMAKIRTFTV